MPSTLGCRACRGGIEGSDARGLTSRCSGWLVRAGFLGSRVYAMSGEPMGELSAEEALRRYRKLRDLHADGSMSAEVFRLKHMELLREMDVSVDTRTREADGSASASESHSSVSPIGKRLDRYGSRPAET
jgi:hypothetical protein